MQRGIFFTLLVMAAGLVFIHPAYCQKDPVACAQAQAAKVALPPAPANPQADAEVAKQKVIAVATEAVKAGGLTIQDVNIVYDEDGKLWSERIGYAALAQNANHGVLVRGFVKNYKIVYFDYKEALKDVWVFIDKDSGEVLEVYQEK
ncbi:MAG: hypothetical protein Q8O22_03095 [Candidatus Omnitrophota bacterium]|nr:hypothetical protein [Candidatus Omnitrophota bacterium]